jgi:hypothetical protein
MGTALSIKELNILTELTVCEEDGMLFLQIVQLSKKETDNIQPLDVHPTLIRPPDPLPHVLTRGNRIPAYQALIHGFVFAQMK